MLAPGTSRATGPDWDRGRGASDRDRPAGTPPARPQAVYGSLTATASHVTEQVAVVTIGGSARRDGSGCVAAGVDWSPRWTTAPDGATGGQQPKQAACPVVDEQRHGRIAALLELITHRVLTRCYPSGTWWARRSGLERRLALLATVLGLMAVGLAVAVLLVAVSAPGTGSSEHLIERRSISAAQNSQAAGPRHHIEDICFTKGCVQAAYTIMTNMDTSVNPCDDFYEFACGSFLKSTVIPDEKTSISQFTVVADALKNKMRKLVEAPVAEDEPEATKLIKNLYVSCKEKERIEERGLQPLQDVLEKMKGWPVVEGDKWDEEGFHWTRAIYRNRALGYSIDHMFDFSVTTDVKNSSWRILDFDQASLGLPRKYLIKGFDDPDIQAYYKYMVDMAVMLGAEKERARSELKESLLFEIQLANISLPAEERRNITKLYNKMTLGEMSRLAPNIPWVTYVNNLLRAAGHQVTADEPVIVDVPDYVKKAAALLEVTPKRVQANYMLWRVVYGSVGMLTEEARDVQLEFSAKLTGQTQRKPRWKECLEGVMGSLSLAVGSLYVRNHFDPTARQAALDMVEHIHQEFNIMLGEVTWMDDKTKERAKEKSKAINYHIAYPEEILNETALAIVYDGLYIDDEHYFENNINMSVFGTNYAFKKLREHIDKNDWRTHGSAAVVNAYYSPIENSIMFPAGILQGIFYDYDRPNYMNYGGIGFVIGHEITHGFDDTGRQFDSKGDLLDWWEPVTKRRFLKGAECMIHQYGNYTVPEINMKLNGVLTQDENIADNGGVRLAYRAYQRAALRRPPRLPDVPLTGRQLFWVTAANVWCSADRIEHLRHSALDSEHVPNRFRINGPFSNMAEFAVDFGCRPGSPMNPPHRCRVW
ncbi:neprilysin-2-like isoform X3 [Pollicipes pollicipes]|uniref:neprilysin-2-like isoform X3 n=2 Tax=Pollicipes pollicipes TaxID=41117 RepID=UPI0018850310|nr:neprilysin-2-like isoform X3 [Pollicipes pollicipes]